MVDLEKSELYLYKFFTFKKNKLIRDTIELLRTEELSVKELTEKLFKLYDPNYRSKANYMISQLDSAKFVKKRMDGHFTYLKLSDFYYFVESFINDFKISFGIAQKALGGF